MDENKTRLEDAEDDMGSNFQKAFGWFLVVNRITDNDFTKHEYVYQKKVTEVLNQLTFMIQYDRYQAESQKNALR
jgi:hypothetical protein